MQAPTLVTNFDFRKLEGTLQVSFPTRTVGVDAESETFD